MVEMPIGVWGAHWRHLVSTTEPSVCAVMRPFVKVLVINVLSDCFFLNRTANVQFVIQILPTVPYLSVLQLDQFAFSALTVLVGCQEEHPACKD